MDPAKRPKRRACRHPPGRLAFRLLICQRFPLTVEAGISAEVYATRPKRGHHEILRRKLCVAKLQLCR